MPKWKLAALALLLLTTPARAQVDIEAANYWIEPCREAFQSKHSHEPLDMFRQGACVGWVHAALYLLGSCIPHDVEAGQGLRIIVRYLDAHPADLNKSFSELALTALAQAWPCKK